MQGLPLFHRLYGKALSRLPEPIVRLHDIREPRTWRGMARVEEGPSLLARAICRLMRFPPATESVPLAVVMEPHADGEIWRRRFGDHLMTTRLGPGPAPGTVKETLWPVTLVSRIDVDDTGVDQVMVALRIFGVPVPRLLWPHVTAREGADGARYIFAMSITLPWGAPLVRYDGWLDPTGG